MLYVCALANWLDHGSNGRVGVNTQTAEDVVIPPIDWPEIGQRVRGKVTRTTRKGVFVDIGYRSMNGRRRDAFLHLEQMKCPQRLIDEKMDDYFATKEEEELAQREWDEYDRKRVAVSI